MQMAGVLSLSPVANCSPDASSGLPAGAPRVAACGQEHSGTELAHDVDRHFQTWGPA